MDPFRPPAATDAEGNYSFDDVLDKDDRVGPGPETITIPNQVAGTYHYAVKYHKGPDSIPISNAVVRVYRGEEEIGAYTAPAGTGEWWHVFSKAGDTGAITEVDTLKNEPPQAIPQN